MHDVTDPLQALVAASIFFVWVASYGNIIAECKQHGLPDSLRDLAGTFVIRRFACGSRDGAAG